MKNGRGMNQAKDNTAFMNSPSSSESCEGSGLMEEEEEKVETEAKSTERRNQRNKIRNDVGN
jgi:hypothetical protein